MTTTRPVRLSTSSPIMCSCLGPTPQATIANSTGRCGRGRHCTPGAQFGSRWVSCAPGPAHAQDTGWSEKRAETNQYFDVTIEVTLHFIVYHNSNGEMNSEMDSSFIKKHRKVLL